MGALTNYAVGSVLNHIFNTAYTNVTTVYLVLCTADPTAAATGASCNEAANSGSYARTAIAFSAAASRAVVQNGAVTFPLATGSWGTITHWCIADSGTHGLGNILATGAFSASFSPVSGNTPYVVDGEVQISIAAAAGVGMSTYLANEVLDMLFNDGGFASTAGNTFIALSNTTLDDDDADEGDMTEVAGTDYARVEVNPSSGTSPKWTAVSGNAITNTDDITFPVVGAGNWTALVALVIVDNSGAVFNILFYDNANVVDQTPLVGDVVKILAGDLDISLN